MYVCSIVTWVCGYIGVYKRRRGSRTEVAVAVVCVEEGIVEFSVTREVEK